MSTLAPTALAARTATAETQLAAAAPGLLADFRAALPRAVDVVAGRLAGAVEREGLGTARRGLVEAAELLGSPRLAEELADAVVHLALAYARRDRTDGALRDEAARTGARDAMALAERLPADEQTVFFERLATEGHNLHPCGRTRLGWTVGVGFEWAIAGNWSLLVEFNHYDFGSRSVTLTALNGAGPGTVTIPLSGSVDIKQRIEAVKLGFNYRFGWDSAVAARY